MHILDIYVIYVNILTYMFTLSCLSFHQMKQREDADRKVFHFIFKRCLVISLLVHFWGKVHDSLNDLVPFEYDNILPELR